MNEQKVSIERLDPRQASVCHVRAIALKYFEREFSWSDVRSSLIVKGTFQEVRVNWALAKTSDPDQRTFVDCRFHFQSRQMWIGSIQVATRNRVGSKNSADRQMRAILALPKSETSSSQPVDPSPSGGAVVCTLKN